jgi:hypothetical protein
MDNYVSEYLAQFDLDYAAVGDMAGQGTQHYIFHYLPNKVIKIPRNSFMLTALGRMDSTQVLRDLEILNQYMPEYVVDTEILCARNGHYAVIQEVLEDAEHLTYATFPLVKDDFVRVVEANQRIVRDHCLTLDLLGNTGYWGCLVATLLRKKKLAFSNNLLTVKQGERHTIKIVDTNLMCPFVRCSRGIGALRALVDARYFGLSRFLIRDNFGVET